MIVMLLLEKIAALCLILCMGVFLVKIGIMDGKDSKVISALSVHLIVPCVILSAFQMEVTDEMWGGMFLAFFAAIVVNLGMISADHLLAKRLHLNCVEQVSIIYSNAGNLVIPIVAAVLGEEWVVYSSAFLAVQMFLLWSHGKCLLCGEKRTDLRKLFTNVNLLSILAGMLFLATGIHFPSPVQDALDSIGQMVGPLAMLVTGMLIGKINFMQVLKCRRIWMTAVLRLIVFPLPILLCLKYMGNVLPVANGKTILLITLIATITPSASTVTQMAQIYGRDAEYAGAINIITTLLFMVTMPIMVALYQL